MLYDISMTISYTYDHPAAGGRHILHMTPIEISGVQDVLESNIVIDPLPSEHFEHLNFFKNKTVDIAFHHPHKSIIFKVKSKIRRHSIKIPLDISPKLELIKSEIRSIRVLDANSPHHFVSPTPRIKFDETIENYAQKQTNLNMTVFEAVKAINHAIYRDMKFDSHATDVDTPLLTAFENRHGVCQDFSHIMIACLRSLHIPAGYVSGFLRTKPPEGQKRLEGSDAMHAWVRAWLGKELGWMEFDPTNDLIVNDDHIVIGYGRDYSDIAPIKGVLRAEGSHSSSQHVDVIPLEQDS